MTFWTTFVAYQNPFLLINTVLIFWHQPHTYYHFWSFLKGNTASCLLKRHLMVKIIRRKFGIWMHSLFELCALWVFLETAHMKDIWSKMHNSQQLWAVLGMCALLLTVVRRLYARLVGEQVRIVPSTVRLRKHLQLWSDIDHAKTWLSGPWRTIAALWWGHKKIFSPAKKMYLMTILW